LCDDGLSITTSGAPRHDCYRRLMAAYADDFGPFDGHIWLNCAHQGPLPKVAVEQAERALAQKAAPHRLPYSAFDEVPAELKSALASVIGCPQEEVVLGNSTTYGLNLLVQGLPLSDGDEVLLVDGDFPATVITWLPLQRKGVKIRFLKPSSWPPTAHDIADALTERTRVFCSSWVFSFFGSAIDIEAIGALCRERKVIFVLNGSQAIGAREIDLSSALVDSLVGCGFKWLCGPYGTGFAWFSPEVLDSMTYEQAYWLTHASPRGPEYKLHEGIGAARYDVFGTANFVNFMAWTASVKYLTDIGISAIQRYDDALVQRSVEGLTGAGYRLISPLSGRERSTLVVFTHEHASRNDQIHRALEQRGVHIELRDNKLRLAPHLYNTLEDIDRAVDTLAEIA
jgi:cysteine desulfurase / selenocysteine lyase